MTTAQLKAQKTTWNRARVLFLFVSATYLASSFTFAQTSTPPLAKPQQPVAAEKNPAGDIPDNQAFVEFKSPLGFSVKVPEGWARREIPGGVSFSDKYNHVQVLVSSKVSAPTLTSLKANEVAALVKSPNAIRVTGIKQIGLPAGSAFVVSYGENSDLNAVTNKAVRLDNQRYYFWNAGKLAVLTLSAPAGADNVDQWQLMVKSFAWR